MYFWYILKKYIFNFFTFLFSFSLLYVVVDYSFSFNKLPSSSNLQILYLFYIFIYAMFLTYPLALAFSFLFTLNKMIKYNELLSFYALGFNQKKLFKPFLYFSLSIFLIAMFFYNTKISYVNEYASSIKNTEFKTKNIFLKFNNYLIFIKELNPILKKAKGMYIFRIRSNNLEQIIIANSAYFVNNEWKSDRAEIINITQSSWIKTTKSVIFLKNFKPKILSNLKKLRDISFIDAYIAIKYFKDVDLNNILSIIFFKIFTPLSMILVIMSIFYLSPIHIRIANVYIFMIKSTFFILLVWGSELLLFKFSKQGVIPYYVLSLPFILLLFINLRRKNEFS